MPEFHLDTAGQVEPPPAAKLWPHPLAWDQLSEFAQGYIEALFFTAGDMPGVFYRDPDADEPESVYVGFADLAPAALNRILNECVRFQATDVFKAFAAWRESADALEMGASDSQAGRDFWFTRCGHGVGFWDRPPTFYGPHADTLTAACGHGTAFPNVDAYLGDDDKVHV